MLFVEVTKELEYVDASVSELYETLKAITHVEQFKHIDEVMQSLCNVHIAEIAASILEYTLLSIICDLNSLS